LIQGWLKVQFLGYNFAPEFESAVRYHLRKTIAEGYAIEEVGRTKILNEHAFVVYTFAYNKLVKAKYMLATSNIPGSDETATGL